MFSHINLINYHDSIIQQQQTSPLSLAEPKMSTSKPLFQHTQDPSFDLRQSSSDMSLHTLPPYSTFPRQDQDTATPIPGLPPNLIPPTSGSTTMNTLRGLSVPDCKSTMTDRLSRTVLMRNAGRGRRGETTDGGSFFTARATLRSVRADGTVDGQEVDVLIGPEDVSSGYSLAALCMCLLIRTIYPSLR
jgi:hypothetical protein